MPTPIAHTFIKNTNEFMWQDLNNIVHIETVNGKQRFKFKNFPIYSEDLTSLLLETGMM